MNAGDFGGNEHSGASKTILLIAKDNSYSKDDNESLEIISLRHPNTSKSAIFLYNSRLRVIQEVLSFKQKYRSGFVDDKVFDGTLHLSTVIDPLFLILPYLCKAVSCSPLDQVVCDSEFPDTKKLLLTPAIENISYIATIKDEKWNAWEYNEENTFLWLKNKIDAIVKVLKQKRIQVNIAAAVSNTFVNPEVNNDNDDYVKYAFGIISDYLSEALSKKLQFFLGIPDDPKDNKRKNSDSHEETVKKLKRQCHQNEMSSKLLESDRKSQKGTIRKSATKIALAKAATGTKSISSFFKKA